MSNAPPIAGWARKRREQLGLTRESLVARATAAGHRVSVATIQAIEVGQRDTLHPNTVAALAAGLNVEPRHVRAALDGQPPDLEDHDVDPGLNDRLRRIEAELARRPPVLPPEVTADEAAVLTILDGLTDSQRRTALRAVARWVAENPDYADAFAADPVGA